MPAKKFDLLVIGELNVDLILAGSDLMPRFGQAEQLLEDAVLALGSSSAILACGAARLGLKVAFAGEVGRDEFGTFVMQQMERRGVDLSGVSVDPGGKTGITVALSQPHDRAMFTFQGTMATCTGEKIPEDLILRSRHVHFSSYFLQPGMRSRLAGIFASAHYSGATTSFDTGWDPAGRWDSGLADVLKNVDIFLPNDREAMAIARKDTVEEALAALARNIPLVVIKQGSRGAVASRMGEVLHVPVYRVDPVETTGAGDNFNAGFLYAYLQGFPLEECLRWGSACGALATLQPGGLDGQRSAAEVRGWMGSHVQG